MNQLALDQLIIEKVYLKCCQGNIIFASPMGYIELKDIARLCVRKIAIWVWIYLNDYIISRVINYTVEIRGATTL